MSETIRVLKFNKKKDKERLSLNVDYKGAPWVKNTIKDVMTDIIENQF